MKFLYSHEDAIDSVLKKISFTYRNLKRFCDLGCGSGHRTSLFCESGRVVMGLDHNDYRLPQHKDFIFKEEDIFTNSIKPSSFDMVLNFDVIEHLNNPEKLLKEIHKILKKDGICILSTPNKYRFFGALLIFLGLRKFPYCLNPNYVNLKNKTDHWHQKEYTAREIKNLVEKNNFRVIKVFKVFYGITSSFGIRNLFNAPFCHNLILILKKRKTF